LIQLSVISYQLRRTKDIIEKIGSIYRQQFSFQKVTICTDRKRDLTGGKIAIANQCWTGVISAIQQIS